ncbi:tetratricopeptide repeat protein [Aestuariivirga sp.]|uniref:tetratricopeptide repeat protein n=1 Tax=Aestuariivirga sp. TaxID=2650926 RepID=UPI0035933FF3
MRVKVFSIVCGLITSLLVESAYADQLSDATQAFERKDSSRAYETWHRLAEQGDAEAQFQLGEMCAGGRLYSAGKGFLCSTKDSRIWTLKAAEKRHTKAMLSLSMRYLTGLGAPEDFAQAHMWANLATINGGWDARNDLRDLEELLSPEQITEGQRLAREWLDRHPI